MCWCGVMSVWSAGSKTLGWRSTATTFMRVESTERCWLWTRCLTTTPWLCCCRSPHRTHRYTWILTSLALLALNVGSETARWWNGLCLPVILAGQSNSGAGVQQSAGLRHGQESRRGDSLTHLRAHSPNTSGDLQSLFRPSSRLQDDDKNFRRAPSWRKKFRPKDMRGVSLGVSDTLPANFRVTGSNTASPSMQPKRSAMDGKG